MAVGEKVTVTVPPKRSRVGAERANMAESVPRTASRIESVRSLPLMVRVWWAVALCSTSPKARAWLLNVIDGSL